MATAHLHLTASPRPLQRRRVVCNVITYQSAAVCSCSANTTKCKCHVKDLFFSDRMKGNSKLSDSFGLNKKSMQFEKRSLQGCH